jgi:hypothetical protein
MRVGRCRYVSGKRVDPVYPGYEKIVVLMQGHSKWGCLGPYMLKDPQGRIFENIWQFSKVYQSIPKSVQRYSRFDPRIIWSHPAETHVDSTGKLTPAYEAWRKKGQHAPDPIRYPVGLTHRKKCLYALADGSDKELSYIESRKEIYVKLYISMVKQQGMYTVLLNKLKNGQSIMIVEVDAPHQEDLSYYKTQYGVNDDFIEDHSMEATIENLDIMLNDSKHPFGHGYCLAMALLEDM